MNPSQIAHEFENRTLSEAAKRLERKWLKLVALGTTLVIFSLTFPWLHVLSKSLGTPIALYLLIRTTSEWQVLKWRITSSEHLFLHEHNTLKARSNLWAAISTGIVILVTGLNLFLVKNEHKPNSAVSSSVAVNNTLVEETSEVPSRGFVISRVPHPTILKFIVTAERNGDVEWDFRQTPTKPISQSDRDEEWVGSMTLADGESSPVILLNGPYFELRMLGITLSKSALEEILREDSNTLLAHIETSQKSNEFAILRIDSLEQFALAYYLKESKRATYVVAHSVDQSYTFRLKIPRKQLSDSKAIVASDSTSRIYTFDSGRLIEEVPTTA